jgi:hypothetical protein
MLETLNYFIAGYVVIFGLIGAYALWLAVATRSVRAQLAALEGQEQVQKAE